MGFLRRARSGLRLGVCALALGCVAGWGFAASTHTNKASAGSAWEQASRARAAFEAQPAGTRTRAAYARILDGFRAIYHANPAAAHAPDAIEAVAEVLAEEGRELEDERCLRAALGQYEFLRGQYPASPLRGPALLAEARIERDDLGDAAAARERLQMLVRESPRSEAGRTARVELAGLRAPAAPTHPTPASQKRSPGTPDRDETAMNGAREIAGQGEKAKADSSPSTPLWVRNDNKVGLRNDSKSESRNDNKGELRNDNRGEPRNDAASLVPVNASPTAPLAQVTGIRHWSTASYTRVAIDLGDEVKFEAARVPNPDRIYFDLHGAKLAQELVGKSFNVTDDGFLKRIRAAQAGPDVTRVVLDVSDVSEYSAFLLPNPYRLIIDIHGGKSREEGRGKREEKTESVISPVAAVAASAAANSSGLPAMATTDGGETVRAAVPAPGSVDAHVSEARHGAPTSVPVPAKPVPNTVAVAKPATTIEVAAVSDSPGKVEATSAPTSKPIVATVPAVRDVSLGNNTRGTRSKPAAPSAASADAAPAKVAEKTADGETSLVRALGLKINRIVIDAGHGGHDSGTLGVDGIQEKDVVLDVALRLGKMLHERLGAEIIYTRSDDTFIPLETRTAIANKAQADLFLSIHANSSPDPSARGVETYYLNFTSDPTALDVAARENAVSGASIHQLSDLVKKITLKDKIAESREFAADVEGSLFAGLTKGNAGLHDRGIKKAPFVVLIGANMPSILAEISFVTNAQDAAQLRLPEYRQRVAESLYAGVARYESGLAGTKTGAPAVKRASLQ